MEEQMGVLFTELDFDVIMKDLGEACLQCQGCEGASCLVGYAKSCVMGCIKQEAPYVPDGVENIPMDTKLFHEEKMIEGIVNILHQCKSCKEEHYENCIVNTLRSCYEIALFGDNISYEGSAFRYLNAVNNIHPEYAKEIIDLYHAKKEAKQE